MEVEMTKDEQEAKRDGEAMGPTIVDRVTTEALMASIDVNLKASIVGNIASAAIRPLSPAFADTLHFIADMQLADARASLDRIRHRETMAALMAARVDVIEVKVAGGWFDKGAE